MQKLFSISNIHIHKYPRGYCSSSNAAVLDALFSGAARSACILLMCAWGGKWVVVLGSLGGWVAGWCRPYMTACNAAAAAFVLVAGPWLVLYVF